GDQDLSGWLAEEIRLESRDWNLEVISPYFDEKGAEPLRKLVETLRPRETRVWLPRDLDGKAAVTKEAFDAVAALPNTRWSTLPGDIANRGRDRSGEKLPPRNVHAKVYRFWVKDSGDVVL